MVNTKATDLKESYKFVVQNLFIRYHLASQNSIWISQVLKNWICRMASDGETILKKNCRYWRDIKVFSSNIHSYKVVYTPKINFEVWTFLNENIQTTSDEKTKMV